MTTKKLAVGFLSGLLIAGFSPLFAQKADNKNTFKADSIAIANKIKLEEKELASLEKQVAAAQKKLNETREKAYRFDYAKKERAYSLTMADIKADLNKMSGAEFVNKYGYKDGTFRGSDTYRYLRAIVDEEIISKEIDPVDYVKAHQGNHLLHQVVIWREIHGSSWNFEDKNGVYKYIYGFGFKTDNDNILALYEKFAPALPKTMKNLALKTGDKEEARELFIMSTKKRQNRTQTFTDRPELAKISAELQDRLIKLIVYYTENKSYLTLYPLDAEAVKCFDFDNISPDNIQKKEVEAFFKRNKANIKEYLSQYGNEDLKKALSDKGLLGFFW